MQDSWLKTVRGGGLVVIDGGMGSELQRRGVPMDLHTWSGMAVVTHPEVVRRCHEEYIRAGAEVIITNTFGCSRQMMAAAGRGSEVPEIVARAAQLALEAREDTSPEVAVAGSISAMPAGFEQRGFLAPDEERAAYREIATALAEAGVDLIALEMMIDSEHAPLAWEAAVETGLPVWLGVSCRLAEDRSSVIAYSSAQLPFEKLLETLLDDRIALVNIMHSGVETIEPAIEVLRERWRGPFGVYPESGTYRHPNWQFVDVIAPDELAGVARHWIAQGARVLGGCCGTGPEHVRALAALKAGG